MSADPRRILCIGAAHWDIIARADGAVAVGDDLPGWITRRPGGVALNVAMGLARLRCRVGLAGVVGNDPDGMALMDQMRGVGVDCDLILQVEGTTDKYVAIEDRDGSLVAAIADARLLDASAGVLADRAIGELEDIDTAFVDANLPAAEIARIGQCAGACGVEVVVNPVSPAKAHRLTGLFDGTRGPAVVCNLAEANVLTGRLDGCAKDAAEALVRTGSDIALVTAGGEPVALATSEVVFVERPPAVPPGASVTGAGDALLAAFLAAPDRRTNPEGALRSALQAAEKKMREST